MDKGTPKSRATSSLGTPRPTAASTPDLGCYGQASTKGIPPYDGSATYQTAVVLIVAALIQFLPFPGTGLVFGVAVALLGFFALAGEGRTSDEQLPSRVR